MRYMLSGALLLLVSLNLYAGGPSWKKLEKNNADEAYCEKTYSSEKKIRLCKIELIALQRAKKLCSRDAEPNWCKLMANSGWKDYKREYAKRNPTEKDARIYPVFCDWKKKQIRLCTEVK